MCLFSFTKNNYDAPPWRPMFDASRPRGACRRRRRRRRAAHDPTLFGVRNISTPRCIDGPWSLLLLHEHVLATLWQQHDLGSYGARARRFMSRSTRRWLRLGAGTCPSSTPKGSSSRICTHVRTQAFLTYLICWVLPCLERAPPNKKRRTRFVRCKRRTK